MENQALLSLSGARQEDTALLNQPVGSLQSNHPHAQPGVLWGEVAMAGEQTFFISLLHPLTGNQKWPWRRWHSISLSGGPNATGGAAPTCPSGSILVTAALLPSMKTHTRISGGGCRSKCFWEREQCGWMKHHQAMKSKQMLSPSMKSSPRLQQAARIKVSA